MNDNSFTARPNSTNGNSIGAVVAEGPCHVRRLHVLLLAAVISVGGCNAQSRAVSTANKIGVTKLERICKG